MGPLATLLGGGHLEACAWSLLDSAHAPFLLTNVNLRPFITINSNHGNKGFSESWESFQQIELEGGLGVFFYFLFEMIIDLQKVACKYREVLCTFHAVSPSGVILKMEVQDQNFRPQSELCTVGKVGLVTTPLLPQDLPKNQRSCEDFWGFQRALVSFLGWMNWHWQRSETK